METTLRIYQIKILCHMDVSPTSSRPFWSQNKYIFETSSPEWINSETSSWSFRVWTLNASFLNQASHHHQLVFVVRFNNLFQYLTIGHAPCIARIFHDTSPDLPTDMTSDPWSRNFLLIRPGLQVSHFCLTSMGSEVSRSRARGLANISS